METFADTDDIDARLAERLRSLRIERGWSLDDLAARAEVSRASLSRLENGEVSPTASVLGRLCTAHGVTLSRLMQMVESGFKAHLPRVDQPLWTDASVGFRRRSVSPPAPELAGEVIECEIAAGSRIAYDAPPRPGLEHHLVLVEGRLTLVLDGVSHDLAPGDCLRYRPVGATSFSTPADTGVRYFLFMV